MAHAETFTIESSKFPDGYFPDGTDLRVEWVADDYNLSMRGRVPGEKKKNIRGFKTRQLAWTGMISGKYTRQWDPGFYVWKAHKHTDYQQDNFSETGAFLIGMTEEEWRRVTQMKPKTQFARKTTDGVAFSCQFVGCSKITSSRIAAVLHEAEHQGVDLLKNPELKQTVDLTIDKQQQPKRGPGRPRKTPVPA